MPLLARVSFGSNYQPERFVISLDPEIKEHIGEAGESEEGRTMSAACPTMGRAVGTTRVGLGKTFPRGCTGSHRHVPQGRGIIAESPPDGSNPPRSDPPRTSYSSNPPSSGSIRRAGYIKTYYSTESCGIAAGMLIAAIHEIGLATLVHTPSPMNFLAKILGAVDGEKPYLVLPVGYPGEGCVVPDVRRKTLEEICEII